MVRVNLFHDIQILVKQLKKPIRNLISEVVKIIKLVIVMPPTNTESERSFSAMRRLYASLLEKLSLVDEANDFVFDSDNRKTLFVRFDDADLRRKSIPVKSVGI